MRRGEIVLEDIGEDKVRVVSCKSRHECYGCSPEGIVLKKLWLRLKEVKRISSMSVSEEELDGLFFSAKGIEKILKVYKDKPEQFFYERRVICDLDTVVIYKEVRN